MEERDTRDADLTYLQTLFGLEGKVALVTGGRQGIGRAAAIALGRAGAAVAVTSRDPESLADVAADLGRYGIEHALFGLEVSEDSSARSTVEKVVERFGAIDVLVNNAGLSIRKPAREYTVPEWDDVLGTNLRGTWLMSRAAADAMWDRGGRIVNLSSTFARFPMAARAAYASSKAGVEQLTRVLAVEWAPRGIAVNAVAPTTVLTESRRALFASAEERDARIRAIPLGRLGVPDDVAGTILLLAGSAGSFITGQVVLVDGGFTLGTASA